MIGRNIVTLPFAHCFLLNSLTDCRLVGKMIDDPEKKRANVEIDFVGRMLIIL